MLITQLTNTNQMKFSTGYSQLAEILVENSVYLKYANRCKYVLFNDDNIDSS